MKIDRIQEVTKEFTIRLRDEENGYEDIAVVMSGEFAKPQSPYFTHCEVKINTLRHRTISQHIEYLKTFCSALEQLQEKLEGKNDDRKY